MTVPISSWSFERYDASEKILWDSFVRKSKNGTFLFIRDYMDYHSDRFGDNSFIVRKDGICLALLPAHRIGDDLHSHQGLTYGGLILDGSMTTPLAVDLVQHLVNELRSHRIQRLFYKTIPWIYHTLPAEEDRYALFLQNASLVKRDVLSVIPAGRRAPVQTRRRRALARADKLGISVAETTGFEPFWAMLTQHLQDRFGVKPVHSHTEIEGLRRHFPANIRLFQAVLDSELLAGIVIFESAMVAHVQYIASSPRGREVGALEIIVRHLLSDIFPTKPYFDFGSSNGDQGRTLNKGLIEQKEGFGARAVVHDQYMLRV